MSSKKKIILSGASGFTGKNLIESIDQEKFEIVAIKRPSNVPLKEIYPHIKELNIGDQKEVERLIKENRVAGVLHLATVYNRNEDIKSRERIWDANFVLGKALLDIAIQSRSHFLHIESYLQYQFSTETEYVKSKAAFSSLVDQARDNIGGPITSLIFFDSYGNNDNRNKILNQLISGKKQDKSIHVTDPNKVIILTSIRDLVEAIPKVIEGSISGRYKVASPDKYVLSDLSAYIASFPHGDAPQRISERVYIAESFPLLETFVQTSNVVEYINTRLSTKSENCL